VCQNLCVKVCIALHAPAEVVEAVRGTAGYFNLPAATAAAALQSRGKSNPNKAHSSRNADVLQLGEEIGSVVIGPEQWNKYIKTSAKEMNQADKPSSVTATQKLRAARLSGERKGRAFDHIALTVSRWAVTDEITFTLPGHTKENPLTQVELLREAISEAYHLNWMRHSAARIKVQKDEDAGTQLPRSNPKTRK